MTVYSYSRINTFKNCPYQYKLQYIDKIKTEIEGIEAFLGTCIHETLEKLYSDLILSKMNSADELLEVYNQKWDEKWHDNIKIVRKEMTSGDYRHAGEMAIKEYYSHYHPFDKTKPLWTERRVMITLGDDNYKLQGFIDRLDRRPDGILEIHDYKSSRKLPMQHELDKDPQLALYQLAVEEAYPEVKGVELVWHYLLFDTELRSTRDQAQLDNLMSEYRSFIDEIEKTTNFTMNETSLCDWCGYWEYCPSKKHMVKIESLLEPEKELEPGYMLVDKYVQLKAGEKHLSNDIDEIKIKLVDYAKMNDVTVIRGTEKRAKISISVQKSFPSKSSDEVAYSKLEDIVQASNLWDDESSLNIRKLLNDFEAETLPEEVLEKLKPLLIVEEKSRINIGNLKVDDVKDE
jgi:RecB family exonuclease